MIKLIVGSKGTGKTKILIDEVNKAARTSNGSVVCVEKEMTLGYEIIPQVRLIHADEYKVNGFDAAYGFICGILASNYDIKDIYIDGILKIGGASKDLDGFAALVTAIDKQVGDQATVTFTVSADVAQLPESLKKYL